MLFTLVIPMLHVLVVSVRKQFNMPYAEDIIVLHWVYHAWYTSRGIVLDMPITPAST